MLAWIDGQLAALSALVGFPADQLAMVVCLLLNYPLGFIFLRLLGPTKSTTSSLSLALRHLYSTAPSVVFGAWLFGWDLLHSLVSSLVGYAILRAMAHRTSSCAKVMFVYAMAYVALSHIYSMYYSYMDWHLDFTRPQMIITIKLTTLAFNLSDSFRPAEDLSPHEKEKQVKKTPSLLEFIGYIYFFPSFLAGPHIYFADYKRFIEGSLYPMGEAPSTVMPTIRKMGEAILCLAIAAPLNAMLPIPYMRTDGFYTHSAVYIYFYMMGTLMGTRFSFYFAWLLSEGSFIACGMGYNGKSKNPRTGKEEVKWDRLNNIDVLGWELGQSPRTCIASWNRQVQQWLYHYVYVRSFRTVEVFDEKTQKTIKVTKKPWYSTLLTNLISAFWHGFYPGYYLGFGCMSCVVEAARILRSVLRHRFVIKEATTVKEEADSPLGKAKEAKPAAHKDAAAQATERPGPFKPLYDVASWVLTQSSLSFSMFPCAVQEFSCSIRAWHSLGWWAQIGCAVLLLANSQRLLRGFEEPRPAATSTSTSAKTKTK